MKNKVVRIIRLLFLISLILFVFSLRTTYSKYQEKLGTTYSVKVKSWKIKVNNTDINGKNSLNEILEPVSDNVDIANYVVSNKIVPGSEKYLLIIIDYSDVGVKFKVDIDIKQTAQQRMEFFKVKGYTQGTLQNYVDNVNDLKNNMLYVESTVDDDKTVYTVSEVIDAPNLEDKIKYIKVYLGWDDENKDGNVTINNELIEKNKYDTAYMRNGVSNNNVNNQLVDKTQSKITYEAIAKFTQVVDEK